MISHRVAGDPEQPCGQPLAVIEIVEVLVDPQDDVTHDVVSGVPVGDVAADEPLQERGIPFIAFEVGDDVAASVRDWAHVQLFSPWGFNMDGAARRLLEAHGWVAPDPDEYPTGADFIDRYLAPLTLVPGIAAGLRTGRLVTSVTWLAWLVAASERR